MNQDLRIMNYKFFKKNFLILWIMLFLILYSLFMIPPASAQVAPEFMVTWKANNYVPSDYQGRILPIDKTIIEIAFEVIDKNKIADLSKTEIFWHINGRFQNSGPGIKNFNFEANKLIRDQLIEIIIPNYQTMAEGIKLNKTLTIPLAKPDVIINSPYPNNEIAAVQNEFKALPYFFNIVNPPTDLFFNWQANTQKIEGGVENPNLLTLDASNLTSGAEFNVKLFAQNLFEETEFANQLITLRIK